MGDVESVLVAGDGAAGWVVAIAMAQRGLDVALVQRSARAADDVMPNVVALAALGSALPALHGRAGAGITRAAIEQAMTDLGIESRNGVSLLGAIDVDHHFEAELSTGQVENFDVIVVADDETARSMAREPTAPARPLTVVRDIDEAMRLAQRVAAGQAFGPA